MTFDLSIESDRNRYKEYARELFYDQGIVELSKKRLTRSLRQSRYLHVLIRYSALELGVSAQVMKQQIWKLAICPSVFVEEEVDKVGNRWQRIRSEADLSTDEESQAIEMLRNHMQTYHNCYLPEPGEYVLIEQMYEETQRSENRVFLEQQPEQV